MMLSVAWLGAKQGASLNRLPLPAAGRYPHLPDPPFAGGLSAVWHGTVTCCMLLLGSARA